MTRLIALAFLAAIPVAAQEADPLRGPTVPETAVRTIVRHDARGRFLPVEGRPESAAITALGLEPAEQEKLRDQVTQRAVDLNVFLVENIDTVKEITDATQANDKARARTLVEGLRDKFDPGKPRDPAAAGLTLTKEQETEFRRILDEYWTAWLDWELRYSRDKSPKARQAKQEELSFGLFQREVREAYERTLKPYRDRLETLYAALEPTEEQKTAIREAVIDYIKEARLAPTPQQREDVLKKIYAMLDPERKEKLFALVASQLAAQR